MTYVRVTDIPATWADYADPHPATGPVPEGLILFAAGPTSEGIRTVEVWSSPTEWALGRRAGGAIPANSTVRELDAPIARYGAAFAADGRP